MAKENQGRSMRSQKIVKDNERKRQAASSSSNRERQPKRAKTSADEYEVEAVVGANRIGKGPKDWEFHIKWRGYPKSENTWEPYINVENNGKVEALLKKKLAEENSLPKKKNNGKGKSKEQLNGHIDDSEESDEGEEFEVEKCLDAKRVGKGDTDWEFQLKWKGYPKSANTWEPYTNVKGNAQVEALLKKKLAEEKATPKNKNNGKGKPKANGQINGHIDESEKSGEEGEFEVEKCLDAKRVGTGDTDWEFQLKWKGYPKSASTWEPYANTKGVPCVEEFLKQKLAEEEEAEDAAASKNAKNDAHRSAQRNEGTSQRNLPRRTVRDRN